VVTEILLKYHNKMAPARRCCGGGTRHLDDVVASARCSPQWHCLQQGQKEAK